MRISLTPKRKISTIALILYIWLGMIYARVSYHLGGTVLILIGYVLLLWVLYPWKFRCREEDRSLVSAICWFGILVCVIVLGTEILHRYEVVKNLGPITMGIDTFHMIKAFPIWLGFMLIQGLDKDAYQYSRMITVIILLDVVITLYALFDVPNFSRYLASGTITEEMRPHQLRGAMGYELTYSVALIVPLLFTQAFQRKKIWLWAVAIIAVFYVLKCNFFLAILLMCCNLCLALVFSIKNPTTRGIVIALALITFVVLLLNQTVLGNFLISLSDRIESYELRSRVLQLGKALLYDDYSGRTLNRLDLYRDDLLAVIKSPVLGYCIVNPDYVPSGHSTILGLWCSFGLFGIVPFFQILRHLYRHTVKAIQSVRIKGVVLAGYIAFILLAVLNPVFADPHILVCVIWVIPTLARGLEKPAGKELQGSVEDENRAD